MNSRCTLKGKIPVALIKLKIWSKAGRQGEDIQGLVEKKVVNYLHMNELLTNVSSEKIYLRYSGHLSQLEPDRFLIRNRSVLLGISKSLPKIIHSAVYQYSWNYSDSLLFFQGLGVKMETRMVYLTWDTLLMPTITSPLRNCLVTWSSS